METPIDNTDKPVAANLPDETLPHAPHHSRGASSHRYTPPHLAYPHRMRRLGVALLLIIILAVGFLGGWLGSGARSNNQNDSLITSSSQPVVTSESQAITNIAKTVGQSV